MFEHNVAHKLNVIQGVIASEGANLATAMAVAFPPASNDWSASLKEAVTDHLIAAAERLPRGTAAGCARDAYLTARGACL